MFTITNSILPSDRESIERAAGARLAHRHHPVAQRLYRRMSERRICLRHPVPMGVKELIAQWLHRDGLVLACAVYTDASGRRFLCLAHAFTPREWREKCAGWSLWPWPVPSMRLVMTPVYWPAPDGVQGRFPDLPF